MKFAFDNSYARALHGLYADQAPAHAPAPRLLHLNRELAAELGLSLQGDLAALFAGNALPEGAQPLAQAYAGHQFGGFSPSLGDGRALLIGEVVDVPRPAARPRNGRAQDATPFSRARRRASAALGPDAARATWSARRCTPWACPPPVRWPP